MSNKETNQLWQAEARKLGADRLVETIDGMAMEISEIKAKVEKMDNHILKAFPGNDVEGHRRYHEIMIQRNSEIRSLKLAIREKTISGLVWSAMVFLGWAVWSKIKAMVLGGL